jgi:hypothetical protein
MLFRAGRNLIRGLILIACVGLPSTEDAAAADIPYPVKAPAVVDVPPSWDGFYLGGQVGYGMDSVGWRNLGSSAFNPLGGLANYYRNNVIGGPGAFVMVAENSNSFGDVIVRKLIAEIAQAAPPRGSVLL